MTREHTVETLKNTVVSLVNMYDIPTETADYMIKSIDEIAPQWQPIETGLPSSGKGTFKAVLAHYKNSNGFSRVVRASYIRKYECDEIDESAGYAEDWCDYNEEDQQFYLPEGWYETNENEDTHWRIGHKVLDWTPLPEPPTVEAADKQESQPVCIGVDKKHDPINPDSPYYCVACHGPKQKQESQQGEVDLKEFLEWVLENTYISIFTWDAEDKSPERIQGYIQQVIGEWKTKNLRVYKDHTGREVE